MASPLRGVLAVIAFASGVAGLLAETAWMRSLSGLVGADGLAVLAVLSAYFAGTACGGWWVGRRVERSVADARDALRTLAGLAGAAALGGGFAALLVRTAAAHLGKLSSGVAGPRHTALAFALALLAFLPSALASGAAFAVLGRGLLGAAPEGGDAGLRAWASRAAGRVQEAATLGGVVGSLGAAYLVLPAWGARAGIWLAAALDAMVAGAAFVAWRAVRGRAEGGNPGRSPAIARTAGGESAGRSLFAVAAAGAAGIWFEIAAVRVLGSELDGTLFAFALVVAAQLLGGATGSAWAGRRGSTFGLPTLAAGAGLVCAAAGLLLGRTPALHAWFVAALPTAPRLAELGTALLLVGPAAAATSAVFVRGAGALGAHQAGFARAAVASAGGSAVAPLLAGVVWFPLAGTRALLIAAVSALVTAALVTGWRPQPRARQAFVLTSVALLVAVIGLARVDLFAWPLGRDERRLALRDGLDGVASVQSSQRTHARRLRTASRIFEGGDESRFGERRQGQLPALLGPAPQRALALGVGTGISLGALAALPSVREVVAIELQQEVLQLLPRFAHANDNVLTNPRVHFFRGDARAWVRRAGARGERFDLVVADLFHPQREGAGGLFTREHFAAVATLLSPDGTFVQWLPLHELPPAALASAVATFRTAFPHASGVFAYFNASTPAFGLVGTRGPLVIDGDALATRIAEPALAAALHDGALDDQFEALGGLAADAAALARLGAAGAIATDDRPSVEYIAAATAAPPYASLEWVLDAVAGTSLPVRFAGPDASARTEALAAYQRAVAFALRGQIAEGRGQIAVARRAYDEGEAIAPRLSLNRLLRARLPR